MHVLRKHIYILHLFGLVYLPNYYKDAWKNQLHRCYSHFILTVYALHTLSLNASLFLYAIKNFGIFCANFFECIVVTICVIDIYSLNYQLARFLKLIESFESMANYHGRNKVIITLNKRLKILVLVISVAVVISVILLCSIPFLPKSPEELETIKKVFLMKYPENSFVLPIYIPFIDPSEPRFYYIMESCNLYLAFLYIPMAILTATMFYSIVFNIKAHFDVLYDFITLFGREHRDCDGRLIYYINIIENESVVRNTKTQKENSNDLNMKSVETAELVSLFEQDPRLYEYYYLKQIILFQKRLLHERKLLDTFYRNNLALYGAMSTVMLMTMMYAVFTPGLLPPKIHIKTMYEAILVTVCYSIYFFCGELLSACNISLKSAMWSSHWYKGTIQSKQAIILFLRMNQKLTPFVLCKKFVLGFEFMISIFKLSYSMFHLLKIQRNR